MPTSAVLLNLNNEHVADALRTARETLNSAEGELQLDFSSVSRIDAAGLHALKELVASAREKSVPITLRGVNVELYKVLKLVRLASHFSFAN